MVTPFTPLRKMPDGSRKTRSMTSCTVCSISDSVPPKFVELNLQAFEEGFGRGAERKSSPSQA